VTDDKRFKQAARRLAAEEGISYTAARRRLLDAEPPGPDAVRYGWEEITVDALSAVVAEHGAVPVRVIWSDQTPPENYAGGRWGVAEPAADGYVIREVIYQQTATAAVGKGARVPVPHRTADGRVEVAALWPLVWHPKGEPFWRWAHNGWSVERPGDCPDGFDPVCPSPELPYEVRVYDVPDGIVGEDHSGGSPSWWTTAWCTSLDSARELADALVAHRLGEPRRPASGDCEHLRAEVWEHVTHDLASMPSRVHQVDAAPDRPVVPRLPFGTWPPGRPESAPPTREPVWYPKEQHPPHYELKVWSADAGWKSLAWFTGGRTPVSVTATLLRIGTGGPYAFAETWGPRHPDAWAHDWTQEGRSLTDYHPDEPYAESSARLNAQQRAKEDWLVAALAERSRGVFTAEQAAERLRTGGQRYRDFLTIGSAAIARALNRARRDEEGAGRLRLREALDALEERHEVPDWAVDLTRTRLDDDLGARATGAERAYVRRALVEYLAPSADTDGVPGLTGA
jgi:hypothetical protein